MAKLSTDSFLKQFGVTLAHEESGNDLSALIPDGLYGDLKMKKRMKHGKKAAEAIIALIGRRPIGDVKHG